MAIDGNKAERNERETNIENVILCKARNSVVDNDDVGLQIGDLGHDVFEKVLQVDLSS